LFTGDFSFPNPKGGSAKIIAAVPFNEIPTVCKSGLKKQLISQYNKITITTAQGPSILIF
jgi:hypothetical protein